MYEAEDVVATAEREWRAMGVVPADRAALVADLRRELEAATADGVSPRQLLGDADLRTFARRLAVEAGATRLPYAYREILRTALAGAVPGLVLSWLILWYQLPVVPADVTPVVALSRYAVCAVALLAGPLLAVRLRLANLAGVDRTVGAMALLLPLTGVLVTPVTMAFASTTGYSTALPVLLAEAAIVGGALAGAVVLARRWALAPVLGESRAVAPGGH